jgi:hypothetical protein
VEELHNYAVGAGEWLVHNGHSKETGKNSKILGKNLTKAGYDKPEGAYEAAHMVPTSRFKRRSQKVQEAIADVQDKMDTHLPGQRNEAVNGFWGLKGKPNHAGTHTNEYFEALGKEFEDVDSAESALSALERIWKRIELGEFL